MSWRLGIVEVGVIPRLPLNLYLPDAPPDELIDPVCYCYLATDGEHNIIVDSGPDRHRSAAEGLEIIGDADALLAAGLAAWGVGPRDIEGVVHTHLHHDHMQNDAMFPNAVVHVQQAEIEWATGPDCDRFYIGARELVDGSRGQAAHGERGRAAPPRLAGRPQRGPHARASVGDPRHGGQQRLSCAATSCRCSGISTSSGPSVRTPRRRPSSWSVPAKRVGRWCQATTRSCVSTGGTSRALAENGLLRPGVSRKVVHHELSIRRRRQSGCRLARARR